MCVNYYLTTNFKGYDHNVKNKSSAKSGLIGAAIGATALGGACLGFQKYLLSDKDGLSIKKYIKNKAGTGRAVNGETDRWWKIFEELSKFKSNNKIQWGKVSIAALIGGITVGGISALVTHCKNRTQSNG